MKVPVKETLFAAKNQTNILIKLALYWLWLLLSVADWLFKLRRKYPEPIGYVSYSCRFEVLHSETKNGITTIHDAKLVSICPIVDLTMERKKDEIR